MKIVSVLALRAPDLAADLAALNNTDYQLDCDLMCTLSETLLYFRLLVHMKLFIYFESGYNDISLANVYIYSAILYISSVMIYKY